VGQAGAAAAGQAEPPSSVEVQSVWDFVVKGGPMMIPIGLCSLVALTVIIERLIVLRRRNVIPPGFLSGLKDMLDNGFEDRAEALKYCRDDGSPIANVLGVGIKRLGEPIDLLEKHIQEAGEREVLNLRKYVRLFSVIAAVAPLMGLLGTIFGMITAFQTVAISAESLGKAELLAKGIYQAMITTAAGLMVAIPVLIAYHWISAKIERLISEIDRMCVDFVEEYAEAHRGGEASGEVSVQVTAPVADVPVPAGQGNGAAAGGPESGDGRDRAPEAPAPAATTRRDDGMSAGAAQDSSQHRRDDGTGAPRESVKSAAASD
jgi:biopolymer transport protein ExbB